MEPFVIISAHSNKWMVVLDPMKPGGPYAVMAQQTFGKMNLTVGVYDVLFGDVWLCSGQSNMQMTVSQVIFRVSVIMNNVDVVEKGKERGGSSKEEKEIEIFVPCAKICSQCFACLS